MKFIILLLSFFLSYGIAIVAADQKIVSKKLNFKDADEDIDRIEMLTKQVQNNLNRIEELEQKLSVMQNQMQKGEDSARITDESQQNSMNDDIFEVPMLSPVLIEEEKIAELRRDGSEKQSNEKQAYDLAIISLKDAKSDKNKLAASEQKFADFIKNFPKSSKQSNAYFWHGETFFRRNIYDQAAISFLKGYKQFPKGEKASDSLLKLALSLGYLKKKNDACGMLAKLEAEFPNRPVDSLKKTKEAKAEFNCQVKPKS